MNSIQKKCIGFTLLILIILLLCGNESLNITHKNVLITIFSLYFFYNIIINVPDLDN